MISSDLKAPELSPRASLPFSWNSDGDSGIATGRPTGATGFQAHLKSAQSAHSLETGSSPVADAPQKAETAESADPSSRVSLPIPSTHLPARPSIKPIRKASLNLRAMVDAKVRFIGPSTASISTPSGTSLVPSAQAGPSSWGEPFGPAERSEADSRRPPALNSGASPRNDVLHGLPERPLMDSRRLPEAEAVILRNKRGDSQDGPSSKQLSGDVFSAPSDAGMTYASRRVTQRPNPASSSESNFEIQRDLASGRENASGRGDLPAAVSTNSGGGKSISNPQTIAAIGARVGAVQNLVNGSLRAAGTAETVQSLPTSRSATASQPSMGNDPIASGVREAARRAVAESQILGTSQVAVASVRPANNNDAFRSLILDPGIETLPSFTMDSAPPFGDRLSDNALRPNSGTPSAFSLSSFLPSPSAPSRISESNGAEPSANNQSETVQNEVPNPTRVQRNLATTAPTPSIISIESGSQNGAFIQRGARSVNPSSVLTENAPANNQSETVQNEIPNPTRVQRNLATTTSTPSIISIESGSQNGAFIQREARSVNPSSELTENASANTPLETAANRVSDPTRVQRNLATTTPTPSIISIESGSQNGAFIQREARSANPSSELIENAPANTPLETVQNEVPNPTRVQRNLATTAPTPSIISIESGSQNGALIQRETRSANPSSVLTENAPANTPLETVQNEVPNPTRVQRNLATTTPTPSIISIESGSQNGEVIQREARSANPNPGLIENPSTVEATDSSATNQSSLAESQSPPKPSAQSLRPANRSPHAKGTDSVVSNISARPSLEADKSSPAPLVLENGTEDRMRLDTLGRDAGSDSSSHPGPGYSQASGTPVTGLFPGASQSPSFQEHLVDGPSNLTKTADAGTSASLLHESHKPSAVRLVHLDSPGAGGLELRIQELGDKLIIRTQDLVGSIDGQSTQWKELQQRLETSGIVLMPIEASLGATAAPIESRSSSEESRHTICYDGPMGSTGRDSSDPRSSSGRARSFGEPSHLASPEPPDETTESAEVPPASRQWWA